MTHSDETPSVAELLERIKVLEAQVTWLIREAHITREATRYA